MGRVHWSERTWKLRYCEMAGVTSAEFDKRWRLVPCVCDDPQCKGWKVERRETTDG